MKKQEKIYILLALILLAGTALFFAHRTNPVSFTWKPLAAPSGVKLNINTADQAALENIPGIGPALADAILTRRAELGVFDSSDGLLTVPGIGESRLAALERYITY